METPNQNPPQASSEQISLPPKYTSEQLAAYVRRQLGGPVWNVELKQEQVYDAINDALAEFSQWHPRTDVVNVPLVSGKFRYLEGQDVGYGVIKVDFVEPNPVPTEIFYGNLIDPTPLFRTGLDEYDTFLRWRKTWQRVTSIQPDWYYDDASQSLFIHNPIQRFYCAAFVHMPFTDVTKLPLVGATWVKKFSTARAQYLLGELYAKFSGALPGPGANLQLDQGKRDKAQTEMDKLMLELKAMQPSTPIMID